MRDVFFKTRLGVIEGAYHSSGCLVLLQEASLPDRCIVCAAPAHGHRYRGAFQPYRLPTWRVPVSWDFLYSIVGKQYLVDFPFCSICTDENFDIHAKWIDEKAGFFSGVSNTLMKSLPRIPPEVEAQLQRTRWQLFLRSLLQ
ncbi:MAG: hypothetical protein ACRD4X_18555 [Candidatus Acidiferrales bacterium]